MKQRLETVMVMCHNIIGEPDVYSITVPVTEQEYDEGLHYERAIESARNEQYDPPFVAFDEADRDRLETGIKAAKNHKH